MELSLAKGWTQVEPKDTPFELLMSGQSPGQRVLASNTSFTRQRDLGFSGGTNCPLAVDHVAGRVYVSVDGIISYGVHEAEQHELDIEDDLSAVWMLEYVPAGPELLMHLAGGGPRQSFIAWLNLENRQMRKGLLPAEAFFPLGLNIKHSKALYSTRQGAAVYDLNGSIQAIATVDLPFQATGGTFDADAFRIILGGNGLFGWKTETGELSHLCERGSYPVIDDAGGVWFSLNDGALAKLRGGEASFEVIVELTEVDTSSMKAGSYAQPLVLSPDGRYGLARLTGQTELAGKELQEAEAFCKSVDQPFSDFHRHQYHHYSCVLDLEVQEVWCHEGYAHNIAWVAVDGMNT